MLAQLLLFMARAVCWQASKTMLSLPTRLALSTPNLARRAALHYNSQIIQVLSCHASEADFNVTTLPKKRFFKQPSYKTNNPSTIRFLLACSVPNVERPLATLGGSLT